MDLKLKKILSDYAKDFPNEESGGLIWYTKLGKSGFEACSNMEANKSKNFRFDENSYLRMFYEGKCLFSIFHTHVSDNVEFSNSDITTAESWGVPMWLYNIKKDAWNEYLPKNFMFSLSSQPFIWGLFDCFSMTRFYFWKNFQIYIHDFDYPDFRSEIEKLIIENFEKEGFVKVENTSILNIQKHDIVIIGNKPHHFGIYKEKNIFFEHKRDILSGEYSWDKSYFDKIFAIMRHRSFYKE